MPINEMIKAAVSEVVRKHGQSKRLADRLESLLNYLADAGSDIDIEVLGRRIDDIVESVKVDNPHDERK